MSRHNATLQGGGEEKRVMNGVDNLTHKGHRDTL